MLAILRLVWKVYNATNNNPAPNTIEMIQSWLLATGSSLTVFSSLEIISPPFSPPSSVPVVGIGVGTSTMEKLMDDESSESRNA